jgi:membrane protein DedA with SNARE-associated domain
MRYFSNIDMISFTMALSTSFATGIVAEIIENVMSLVARYGYPAVFAAALLETIFPPIPSELIFPLVGFTAYSEKLGIEHAIGMAAVGALGSTVGGILIYYIASVVGKSVIIRFGRYLRISESSIQKVETWFDRYGEAAIFLGRMVPGVREIISIPAGIIKMNLPRFIIFTFLGSLAWSVALSLVGYFAGQAWEQSSRQFSFIFSIAAIVIVVGFVTWFGIRHYYYSSSGTL